MRSFFFLFWVFVGTVLSDADKRFLYDVGVYNDDDDGDDLVSSPHFSAPRRPPLSLLRAPSRLIITSLTGSPPLTHLSPPPRLTFSQYGVVVGHVTFVWGVYMRTEGGCSF